MKALGNLGRGARRFGMQRAARRDVTSFAALLAARRGLSVGSVLLPPGVGRLLPMQDGRRHPLVAGTELEGRARRTGRAVRSASVAFASNARTTLGSLGEARPEDGLGASEARARRRSPRRRRRVTIGRRPRRRGPRLRHGHHRRDRRVGDPPFVVNNNDGQGRRVDQRDLRRRRLGRRTSARCAPRSRRRTRGPGADKIYIEPGTYSIGIAPINENAANVGDFEILDPSDDREARRASPGDVIIDGGKPLPGANVIARGLDRLFEIHPGAGDVTFKNVTLRNGFSPEEGGAIQNWSLGKLTLDGVTVKDNYAEKAGGGVNHADLHDYPWTTEPPNLDLLPFGRVEIKRSTFTGNGSGGGSGAAINNVSGGTITISDQSVITLNPGAIMPDPLDPEEFVLVDPGGLPVRRERDREPGAVGGRRHDQDLRLGGLAERGRGERRRHPQRGRQHRRADERDLTQNRTGASGGGLYTEGGNVSVVNSTVSKNQAANGGGLYSGGHVTQFGLRGRFDVKGSTDRGEQRRERRRPLQRRRRPAHRHRHRRSRRTSRPTTARRSRAKAARA